MMDLMKLTKFAVVAAAVSFGASAASAATISLFNDDPTAASGGTGGIRGTVTCSGACDALVYSPGVYEFGSGDPGTAGSFQFTNYGEVFYDNGSSGAAAQLALANELLNAEFTSLTEDVDSASGGTTYNIMGDVVFLKIGNTPEIAAIRNTSGVKNWSFSFEQAEGTRGDLSNFFTVTYPEECPPGKFTGCPVPVEVIPVPATLPLLAGGLALAGFVMRRRRKDA